LLDKSMAEAEAGEFVVKGIEDLEEYEWKLSKCNI
jgi:hypothetical protein